MHRFKKLVLGVLLGAAAGGFTPLLEGGSRSLQAAGTEFLYLDFWGLEMCWSDCAEGAICCKLVYLVEE